MGNKKLYSILQKMKIPVAYNSFKEDEDLPYIIFVQNGSDNFGADNKVYAKNNNYRIELYTSNKNFEIEEQMENLLDEYEIYWKKSGDIRIESEKMTVVYYYI